MADLVPTMTGNSAPSGTVSSWTGTTPWHAFDDSASTYFYGNAGGTKYLQYQFTAGHIVEWYSVTAHGSYTPPTGWTLKGSNNGSDWTTLDTQAVTYSGLQTKSYGFSSADSYSYYKLDSITASATDVRIYEVQFYTGPHTAILPLSVASAATIGTPYVVLGTMPPDGVEARPMPTFRPELLTVGVGPLSGATPAVPNPTLDVSALAEGLVWEANTRGGMGGASFYARQPTGSRSTQTSTNLCPDPEGTAETWWPA